MKNKKRQFKDTAKLKNIIFYIFAFVIFFVPLIVKLKVLTVPDYVMKYYPADKTFDFFTYYKAMLLIMGTTVIFPLVVYYRYKIGNKIKFDLVAKLHLAFGASILLSTLLSSYKQVAFFGFFNKNEGALTWWAYLLLSYSIYLFVESKAEVTKFVKVIVASTTTISVIGLFQFMGLDYIKFDWIQRLIYGPYYAQIKQSGVTMMFPERTVYSTVANPNYIGSVMALAIPLILYLFMESKNRQEKLITGCLAFLHLFILVASKSTAGLLAVGVTMAGYGVYKLTLKKQFKLLAASIAVVIFAVIGISYSGMIDAQLGKVKSLFDVNQATVNPFKKIEIDGRKMTVSSKMGEVIAINHNGKNLWVENQQGDILSAKADENGLLYVDDFWQVQYDVLTNLLMITLYDAQTDMYYQRKVHLIVDGYTIFGNALTTKDVYTEKVEWFKNESSLNQRGYIWNRTLPMIIKKPIIGHGADSFVLAFPQNDLLGKDRRVYNQLVDKSHNAFLQIFCSFGAVGLLCFIFALFSSINGKSDLKLKIAVIAYVIVGLANDSALFTSSLFFCALGLTYLQQLEESK